MRAKRCVAENLARCRPALHSKEEARLGIQIRVAPAVQDDSGNVPAGIEARGSKYLAELFADPSFIVHERRSDHLSTAPVPLAFGGKSRKRVQNFQTEYDGRIWADRGILDASQRQLANLHVIPDSLKPSATAHSHFVQERPVPDRNIRHHAGRAVELGVRIAVSFWKIFNDVLRSPASARHDHRARFHFVQPASLAICDRDRTGFICFPVMHDVNHGG